MLVRVTCIRPACFSLPVPCTLPTVITRRSFVLGGIAGAILASCGDGSDPAARTTTTGVSSYGAHSRSFGDLVLHRSKEIPDSPNVVFISLDDTNDWLGFLGNHPGTVTPDLDALAARSLVFTEAYCTAPICLPSRVSVLFGLQPFTAGLFSVFNASDETYLNQVRHRPSLIDSFWAAGYSTFRAGKVFHTPPGPWGDLESQRFTEAQEPPKFPADLPWRSPYDQREVESGKHTSFVRVDFGPSGMAPEEQPEGKAAGWVRERLRAEHDRPFFLSFGVEATHAPWRVPQQFFDLHPIEEVVPPELRPEDLEDLGVVGTPEGEIVDATGAFEALTKHGLLAEAVQAYQAAQSYSDWLVGQVLDELEASPHSENTIVVVWSDHGFHLGEKMHLRKDTLWDRATHVPLVVNDPTGTMSSGEFDRPVSLIDIGPTLGELCGVAIAGDHEGESLIPVLADPDLAEERPPIMTRGEGNFSVRRGQWRYTAYASGVRELYDHSVDPEEFTNLAGDAEYATIEEELAAFLPDTDDGNS